MKVTKPQKIHPEKWAAFPPLFMQRLQLESPPKKCQKKGQHFPAKNSFQKILPPKFFPQKFFPKNSSPEILLQNFPKILNIEWMKFFKNNWAALPPVFIENLYQKATSKKKVQNPPPEKGAAFPPVFNKNYGVEDPQQKWAFPLFLDESYKASENSPRKMGSISPLFRQRLQLESPPKKCQKKGQHFPAKNSFQNILPSKCFPPKIPPKFFPKSFSNKNSSPKILNIEWMKFFKKNRQHFPVFKVNLYQKATSKKKTNPPANSSH